MKKIIENIHHQVHGKRVLLIGTGGGNDIYSSLLFAMRLNEFATPEVIDIGGMLSSAAFHYYDGKPEQVINKVGQLIDVSRNLQDKDKTPIKFVDGEIHKAISYCADEWMINNSMNDYHDKLEKKWNYLHIDNVYHFSTLYGSVELSKALNKLVAENKYDIVIGIDVGGDILSDVDATSVLSPLMDMTCLYALGNVNVPSYILEYGYGTDGESGNKSMCENIGYSMGCSFMAIEDTIDPKSWAFEIFKGMYNKVVAPVRSGHTIPLFIESCESTRKQIISEHNYTYRLGSWTMQDKFNVILNAPFNKAYLFDAKMICDESMTAIPYSSPIEYALYLKNINSKWASELDLQSIDLGGNVVLFGLLSSKFSDEQRKDVFENIMANIGGKYDYALVWRKDIEEFGIDANAAQYAPVLEFQHSKFSDYPSDYDVFLVYRNTFLEPSFMKTLHGLFSLQY